MTFDELVNVTHAGLAAKAKRKVIPRETVQRVLEDAGLVELMKQAATIGTTHRLLLHQLYFKGSKWQASQNVSVPFEYRRSLSPGLNGWIGGNSTGKSTILKIIVWALSGDEPNFKADVRAWLEDVAVEFEIVGEGVFTVRFFPSLDKTKVAGSIFAQELDFVLAGTSELGVVESFTGQAAMTQAIDRFFGSRLGFSPLAWVQPKRYSIDLEQGIVSWSVYAQAMFIGADDFSDFLFPDRRVNGKHHQRTLGMYLGLDLLEAMSKVQMSYEQARTDYSFERKRVQVNAAGARQWIAQLKNELAEVESRLQNIDAGQSILVDVAYVDRLREQVASYLDRVAALANSEQELLEEERRIKGELHQAERIRQDLGESIQFKLFLSGLEVERCPRCENAIPEVQVKQELETGTCRVCHRELRPTSTTDQQSIQLKQAEGRVRQLKSLMRRIQREIKQVRTGLAAARQELGRYEAEISDLARQEQEGFTSEMRTLTERQGYLRGQLRQLEEQTEEAQSQRLDVLRTQRNVLQSALQQLRAGIAQRHEDILDRLERLATDLVKSFGVRNVEQISLEKKRFEMLIKQSGRNDRFPDMEPGEQLRLKIAFHLALLTQRIEDGIGRHPGLLIIDAPGSAELDQVHFGAILEGLKDTKDRLKDRVQILVASTKEELVDVCGAERVEHRQDQPLF